MEDKTCLKQTQHILNVTRETVDQGLLLQRSIVEKFKKCALDELDIVTGSHSESNAEIDTEVINITEDNAEIKSFTQNKRNTHEKLLEVWAQSKIKKENQKRTMCHRYT
ncbi:unnamed protein product [Rhizophagus irregularis]|nr:unnamed protein product [Rhizophagus irregularis]